MSQSKTDLAAMSPNDIAAYKEAYYDENKKVLRCCNPMYSDNRRARFLKKLKPDQRANEAEFPKLWAFYVSLDDAIENAGLLKQIKARQAHSAQDAAFRTFITDFAPNLKAAEQYSTLPTEDDAAGVFSGLTTFVDDALETIGATMSSLTTGAQQAVEDVGKTVLEVGDRVQNLGSTVQDRVDEGLEQVGDTVERGQQALRSGLNTLGNALDTSPPADDGGTADQKQVDIGESTQAPPRIEDTKLQAFLDQADDHWVKDLPFENWSSGWVAFADARAVVPYYADPTILYRNKGQDTKYAYGPTGVTWHWTGGWRQSHARQVLGYESAAQKHRRENPGKDRSGRPRDVRPLSPRVSWHYGVGLGTSMTKGDMDEHEGVERYVGLEDRSHHAGKKQLVRWDGYGRSGYSERSGKVKRVYLSGDDKASRTTIGIEVVNRGKLVTQHFTRRDKTKGTRRAYNVPPEPVEYASISGEPKAWPVFSDVQYDMMIAVGREIVARWPHLRPWHHHGHMDICPGYKSDPQGLDFHRLLCGIYPDETIPDIWTPLSSVAQRQRTLNKVCALNSIRSVPVDDAEENKRWTVNLPLSVDDKPFNAEWRAALLAFQDVLKVRKQGYSSWLGEWSSGLSGYVSNLGTARSKNGVPPEWEAERKSQIADLEKTPGPRFTAVTGYWTSFTNWDVYNELKRHNLDLADVAGEPEPDDGTIGRSESV
ncbi:MAG: N-acetylmuramoyl-L-alanine amidase [Pseudomonadota bacterium]